MFKFLKEKLKKAVQRVTKSVEAEPEEIIEAPKAEDFKIGQPPKEEVKVEEKPVEAKEEPVKEEPKIEEKPVEVKEEVVEAEEAKEEVPAVVVEEIKPKKVVEEVPKSTVVEVKEKIVEEVKPEIREEPKPVEEESIEIKEEPVKKEKKGFFAKLKQAVATKKISESKFDELFWELEVALLESNVAFEVIEKIKNDLKGNLVDIPIRRGDVEKTILDSLKKSIESLFEGQKAIDVVKEVKEKSEKPYVIVFLGANGSGKTTSIAKLTYLLQKDGLKCGLAAADTWRSAAIQQLDQHAKKLNVPIVKHDYGADPAAVAFDAVKMARARNLDAVLIDTAGRQHSNTNLMDEMKKIVKISNPDLKLYVGEMIAGNDCIEQISTFDEAVQIDGVILSKADIDEKGGTAISVTYVTKKPIAYLGIGQEYKDLELFDKEKILKNLGL